GSFSRDADAMVITHPAASAAIRRLEERLGTQLLSRTTRHLELTADGTAYYERCVRLLGDLEEADSAFGESAARPKGKLRVDVPSRVARTVIVPALGAFFERYPELEVELGVTDRPIDLLHEGVDCAVRVGGPEDPRLVRT